jgi:hypothetical protein
MPFYGHPPGMSDFLRSVKDRQQNDRQVGVPIATLAGSGNGNPDMRKLYSPELQSSTMTLDGPHGMQCGFITNIIGNQFFTPGDPLIKEHTSTSNFGGTFVRTQATTPDTPHSESEMTVSCSGLLPPPGGPFPWTYYHSIGTGDMPAGYYYFLSPTDGPHPGKGPGWPP